ncbi:MAG TPA: N-acetylmuramic acid 6-phosphate etherase [Terriglobia bacterium]|nr:N-acetylmuramic acid 6-phosphate etherase [Terriglobia bacterium]
MVKRAPLRVTERENPASVSLDSKSTAQILRIISREDHGVAPAVRRVLPSIERAVEIIVPALAKGGRLIYVGAGTSGRLGALDAAECIPTFGTHQVVAVLAGGRKAMFRAVEAAEDRPAQAAADLRKIRFASGDVLVGISASGRTPYVAGAMRYARKLKAPVIALTCNPGGAIIRLGDVAMVPVVGPEVLTGSTRMKAGTAQKMVLTMLSTTAMVRLGRVFSNLMVEVQINNAKLRKRGQDMVAKIAGASPSVAASALTKAKGSLPLAILMILRKVSLPEAEQELATSKSAAEAIYKALRGSGKLRV